MKTSNFARHGNDPNAISIARRAPRDFKRPRYPALAPHETMLQAYRKGRLTVEQYRRRYEEKVLARLDPLAVYTDLVGLVFGEPILLCWEEPDEFCHRHLVAAWFREAGIECEEVGHGG